MDVRLEQDYQVCWRCDLFVVRDDGDGEILCSESSAVVALQTAVDALQGQGRPPYPDFTTVSLEHFIRE